MGTLKQGALLAVAVVGLLAPPSRAQVVCAENEVYADRYDTCVSRIGFFDDQWWICGGHQHPQFQIFPDRARPTVCCRKNWPPPADGSGRGKGLCHRWKPTPYHITDGGQP